VATLNASSGKNGKQKMKNGKEFELAEESKEEVKDSKTRAQMFSMLESSLSSRL